MKREKFLIHAVILAVAGFMSRILGLLYAVPLFHIIGEEGNGYYGTAYEIYNMLLLLTAYGMPMAISKLMSVYVAEKDYVNCKRLFRTCIFYVVLIGGIGSAITFFWADKMVVEPAVLSLKVMAPTIFFSGLLSVFRGYTQAHNTMVPTALSQIVEQVFNAVFSIWLAYILVGAGARVIGGNFPDPAYGAMGSAAGTLIGVLVALIYMVIYIMLTKKKRQELYAEEQPGEPESYFSMFRLIFMYASPIILTSFLYNLSSTLDMKIFWNWALDNGYSQETGARVFGIFSRQYLVLINVPITIASAISSSMMPGLSVDVAAENVDAIKTRISKAVRTVVVLAIPAAVGLMVLSEPIMQLLFRGTSKSASQALAMGSVSVVFFSIATVLISCLQAMNKSFLAIKNVTKALIVHLLFVVGMLKLSGAVMGILVAGSVIYSASMCIENINSMEKYLGCKLKVISLVGKPVVASLVMGVVAALTSSFMHKLGAGNLLVVVVTIALSVAVYFLGFNLKEGYLTTGIFGEYKTRNVKK